MLNIGKHINFHKSIKIYNISNYLIFTLQRYKDDSSVIRNCLIHFDSVLDLNEFIFNNLPCHLSSKNI